MLLSKIVEQCFYRSGQYILNPNLSELKLNMQGIWDAFEPEVHNYEDFCPLTKRFNILTGTYFQYDFSFDSNNIGYQAQVPLTNDFGSKTFSEGDSIVTVTFPYPYIEPGSITIYFNDEIVATDDMVGTLVFSIDPENYGGQINYISGTIAIDAASLSESNTVDLKIEATYTTPGNPPKWISGLRPVGTMQVISVLAYWMSPMVRDIYSPSRLTEPRVFLWEYAYPKLYYSEVGYLDIQAEYNYEIIPTYDSNNCLQDIEIVGIEKSSNFYILQQILLGRFMQVIGLARSSFTFNEFPITTNATDLVNKGTAIYDKALLDLRGRHDWQNAIRP